MKRTALPVLAFVLFAQQTKAQNVISAGSTLTQNFNAMGTNLSLPPDWKVSAAGSGATANWADGTNAVSVAQNANSGTPTTGGAYNWGTAAGTDRAVGFMASAGYASPNAVLVKYTNNTGAPITSVTITFQIERYRINTGAFSLSFYDSPDGSTWAARTGGDISAAVFQTGATAYTFATPQTVYKTVTVSGLNIGAGNSYYLRWVFTTAGGTGSQGLGLDNVSISTNTVSAEVSARLVDAFPDPNSDNRAKPGDLITYSSTIRSNGKTANGVVFNATLDPNTTASGAVRSSAVANDDNFSVAINTSLSADAANGVLLNDFGLPTKTVVSFGPTETPSAITAGNLGTSDNGGSVRVNADGSFAYSAPTGFVGYDRFTYVAQGGVTPDDNSNIGIVTIAVGAAPSAPANENISSIIGNVSYAQTASASTGLLFNDGGDNKSIGSVNGDPAKVGTAFTTTNGSNVTVNGDGSFTYNPGPGYEGTEVINYTIDNGFSSPVAAQVSITVSGMIWFINNAAGTTGDGRLSSPFNSIAAYNSFSGLNNPAANDNIFIYESGTNYTGPLALLNGQKLIGQDATASLETITEYSTQLNKTSLPAMSSGDGTVTKLTTTVAAT
ncbi:MAG TPA: Ig-like domain-containing protein, partial [Flavisolibacter sp.]|nr:Ig-like domain-containing protein [Flavisolibacter sp.]